ncbi:MAG: MBL fold metallo-hydrolase [archaeon]
MHVFEENGVMVQGSERILIDPHRRKASADKVIVSHAHSDHVSIGASNSFPYFMTPPTHGLIEKKIPEKAKTKKLKYNTHFHSGNEKISLVSSGHILGSSQVVIEGEQKIVTTTDFKLQDSLVQKGAEIIPCDVLVIESTFGKKEFSFPSREEVYLEMEKWLSHAQKNNMLPVLAGYATGKAQELTKIVNEFSSMTPFVHDSIFEKNTIAEEHGFNLGEFVKVDHNLKDAEVLILPPQFCSPQVLHAISVSARKPIVSSKCTGWGWKDGFDSSFRLSDHADYNQLLEYVRVAQPKQVYTHHGFERELAQSIQKELNILARPLSEARQLALAHY